MNKAHTKWYLIVILLIALILRIITAANLEVGHDEMIYSTRGINFISSGQLSTIDQSPLYFYTLDMVFKIFGYSVWSFRILDIIAAGLTVLVLFLIGKELYSEKVGFLAAFLFGVSPIAIRWNVEMNPTSTFLLMLSVLFFVKGFKKCSWFYFSITSLGIAILFKPIASFILPIFLLSWLYWYPRSRRMAQIGFVCAGLLLAILLPLAAHNHLAYTQKGGLDFWTAKAVGIKVAAHDTFGSGTSGFLTFNSRHFLGKIKEILLTILRLDPLILLLPFAGLLFLRDKRSRFLYAIPLSFILLYAYVNVTGGNHLLFFMPFLSILAAQVLCQTSKDMTKKAVGGWLTAILLLNLWLTAGFLEHDTPHADLRSYVLEEVPKTAFVIVDSRVIRFVYGWALHDRTHVTTGDYIVQNMGPLLNSNPNTIAPLFFLSCAADQCGWKLGGKENSQAARNTALVLQENLVQDRNFQKKGEDYLTMYRGHVSVNSTALSLVGTGGYLYFYPTYWNHRDFFDAYTPKTVVEKVIHFFGRGVLYASLVCFLLLIALTIHLVKKEIS